jgi:hypothetical protein
LGVGGDGAILFEGDGGCDRAPKQKTIGPWRG